MHCTPSCCSGCSSPSARGELPLRVSPLDAAVDVGCCWGSIHLGGIHSGSPSALIWHIQPFCRKWVWWYSSGDPTDDRARIDRTRPARTLDR